jgi:hypothetical protein
VAAAIILMVGSSDEEKMRYGTYGRESMCHNQSVHLNAVQTESVLVSFEPD